MIFPVFLLCFGINQARAEGFLKFSLTPEIYPGKAVSFLQGQDFSGRLFNPYNWGGYLIWQYPQRQVFIDGRCLEVLVYQDGTALIFLRDTPANHARYSGGYLDKRLRTYTGIVSEGQTWLREKPATKGFYELLGVVYLKQLELGKAREMFEKYREIDPNSLNIIQNLNLLRQMNGEAPLPLPAQPKSPHGW